MMSQRFLNQSIRLLGAVLAAFCVSIPAVNAQAQDDDEGPPETFRMAVLDVPGGGTDILFEELRKLPKTELEDQKWFIEQLQSRGVKAKGVMRRADDLKFVMEGAELHYVFFVAPEDEKTYTARLIDRKTGKPVFEADVNRSEEGLNKTGAELIRRRVAEVFEERRAPEEEEQKEKQAEKEEQTSDETVDYKKQAEAKKKQQQLAASKYPWLYLRGGFRLFQRDFGVAGANDTTLTYKSAFYPGFSLGVESYPFGTMSPDYQALGAYADFRYGAASVSIPGDQGEAQDVAISHIEFEGGFLARATPGGKEGEDKPLARLKLGIRYASMSADKNPELPSIAHVDVLLGALVDYPVLADGFFLTGMAEVDPLVFMTTGKELFGESATSYGFASELGLMYKFTDNIGARVTYDLRLVRTNFTGEGTADFVESNSFELVQGLTAGIQYQM